MTLDDLFRIHLAMLCALHVRAQEEPIRPWLTYDQLAGEYAPFGDFELLAEVAKDLRELGLISGIDIGSGNYNDQLLITPRGAAFAIASADYISTQAHGLTDDYPDEWIDALFASADFISNERLSPFEKQIAPASDRYVRTTDNRVAYDTLAKSLNQIRDEFARDHNKGELAASELAQNLLVEIDTTLAQIQRGTVRVRQLSEGLRPQLAASLLFFSAYPGLAQFIRDASEVLAELLRGLGIM